MISFLILNALSPQLDKILDTIKDRNKKALPLNFDSLDPLAQFTVIIPLAFPSLKVRAQILSGLIKDQGLKDDFTQAIIAGVSPEDLIEKEAHHEEVLVPEEEVHGSEVKKNNFRYNHPASTSSERPLKNSSSSTDLPPLKIRCN